jgi:chemotaxis protein MotB
VHQRKAGRACSSSSRLRRKERNVSAKAPIIVIKKKSGHAGHHGGAWKVAYADFVTAMMALFIVLWLMNSSKQIQQAVGGYFKDPTGTSKMVGSDMRGSGENFSLTKDNMAELKEELQRAMRQVPNIDKLKNHIDMTVTSEGLRIELLESATSTFFNSGNSDPNTDGRDILILLAQELGTIPNKIAIEGHTDSKPYPQQNNYGNWELSADRANAARRLMQQNGIREDQVIQVRGFADQRLRKVDAPLDPSNRRVSLIVEYQNKDEAPERPDANEQKSDSGTSEPASKDGPPSGR